MRHLDFPQRFCEIIRRDYIFTSARAKVSFRDLGHRRSRAITLARGIILHFSSVSACRNNMGLVSDEQIQLFTAPSEQMMQYKTKIQSFQWSLFSPSAVSGMAMCQKHEIVNVWFCGSSLVTTNSHDSSSGTIHRNQPVKSYGKNKQTKKEQQMIRNSYHYNNRQLLTWKRSEK